MRSSFGIAAGAWSRCANRTSSSAAGTGTGCRGSCPRGRSDPLSWRLRRGSAARARLGLGELRLRSGGPLLGFGELRLHLERAFRGDRRALGRLLGLLLCRGGLLLGPDDPALRLRDQLVRPLGLRRVPSEPSRASASSASSRTGSPGSGGPCRRAPRARPPRPGASGRAPRALRSRSRCSASPRPSPPAPAAASGTPRPGAPPVRPLHRVTHVQVVGPPSGPDSALGRGAELRRSPARSAPTGRTGRPPRPAAGGR